MTAIARTRAEINVRSDPQSGAQVVDRYPTDFPVEIEEDLNRWYKVKPVSLLHSQGGYLPQTALAFPVESSTPVFPNLPADPSQPQAACVPETLKVTIYLNWLAVDGKPEWIADNAWDGMVKGQQADLLKKMRDASLGVQPRWDDWLSELRNKGRLEEASMKEWIVIMEGGRDEFAIRDHYIYLDPRVNNDCAGWVLKGQILRWTGAMTYVDNNNKRTSFCEVDFYRLSRYMHGWFRADLLADYIFPPANLDPGNPGNAQTVFDLSKTILRQPQDQEIADAKAKRGFAAQYIDVFDAINSHMIHWSLCGEFCVAALGSFDVLPMLKSWVDSKFWRVQSILHNPHEGTSVTDLKSLLAVVGLSGETYSTIPASPQFIKDRLSAGQFAIIGCGINSGGKVKAGGKIRHWVVLVDVLPVGNSGWVRVYNPFYNRDEVYNYTEFLASAGMMIGLWIDSTVKK